jgi:hypothetical protein
MDSEKSEEYSDISKNDFAKEKDDKVADLPVDFERISKDSPQKVLLKEGYQRMKSNTIVLGENKTGQTPRSRRNSDSHSMSGLTIGSSRASRKSKRINMHIKEMNPFYDMVLKVKEHLNLVDSKLNVKVTKITHPTAEIKEGEDAEFEGNVKGISDPGGK